jgi:uncharacterized cofD-like protein
VNAKTPRLHFMRWLYPGLGVKRWLLVALAGALLFSDGAFRWYLAEGIVFKHKFKLNEAIDTFFDDFIPISQLMWIFMGTGLLLIVVGFQKWMNAVIGALTPKRKDIVDVLFDRRLQRGYKIVAIGGGTGLATLLRGLKKYTSNLTAVVTVTDDGGSSGRLQKELGILPPGDIRNCLVALADDEAMVTDLFRYRFTEGDGLTGHSFGNLFLAAMTGITGNFDRAVKESSRVLNIKGRVLPATLTKARLGAQLADGTVILGETNISQAGKAVERLFLDPAQAEPLPEVIAAIREADAIVLGPGSLYTSILPNLLVHGIAHEIAAADCAKIYVCNVMTQPGETDAFTASQHVRALLDHAGERVCEYAVINEQQPLRLLEAYAQERQIPVQADTGAIEALGLRVVGANVINETQTVRHDPKRLAEVLIKLIDEYVARRASFMKLKISTQRESTSLNGA